MYQHFFFFLKSTISVSLSTLAKLITDSFTVRSRQPKVIRLQYSKRFINHGSVITTALRPLQANNDIFAYELSYTCKLIEHFLKQQQWTFPIKLDYILHNTTKSYCGHAKRLAWLRSP